MVMRHYCVYYCCSLVIFTSDCGIAAGVQLPGDIQLWPDSKLFGEPEINERKE